MGNLQSPAKRRPPGGSPRPPGGSPRPSPTDAPSTPRSGAKRGTTERPADERALTSAAVTPTISRSVPRSAAQRRPAEPQAGGQSDDDSDVPVTPSANKLSALRCHEAGHSSVERLAGNKASASPAAPVIDAQSSPTSAARHDPYGLTAEHSPIGSPRNFQTCSLRLSSPHDFRALMPSAAGSPATPLTDARSSPRLAARHDPYVIETSGTPGTPARSTSRPIARHGVTGKSEGKRAVYSAASPPTNSWSTPRPARYDPYGPVEKPAGEQAMDVPATPQAKASGDQEAVVQATPGGSLCVVPLQKELQASSQEAEAEEEEEDSCLLQQVTKVLRALESKTTPAAAALARLRELSSANPEAFPQVIGQCVDMVLSCTGPHLDACVLNSAFDVIVAACDGARARDGTSLVIYTFSMLVSRLGDKDGACVPRNKFARCYGARLLGRLLPLAAGEVWPEGLQQGCEGVLTRLGSDRAPAVRLAAVPGLTALKTPAAHAALVRLSVVDSTAAIRVAALKAIAQSDSSLADAKLPLSRCLDAAPAVRLCLYTVLAKQKQGENGASIAEMSNEAFVNLLEHGMEDVNTSVRAAAEEMLCGWLRQKASSASPLLELLAIIDVEANEILAEKVINCLAAKDDWRDVFWSISREPLADYDDFRSERSLIWRIMVARDGGAAKYIAEFGLDQIIARVENGMQRNHVFEIRQLLLTLASAGANAHCDFCNNSCGGCKLVEMATSVLLRVPLNFDMEQKRPSAMCLALVVIQIALKGCSHVGGELAATAQADARFLDVVSATLSALRSPSASVLAIAQKYTAVNPSTATQECPTALQDGFDSLGEKFDSLIRQRQSSEDEDDEELVETSESLALVTRRAFAIAEEALSMLSTSHADDSLVLLEDLPSVWFRPTLVRADLVESAAGGQLPSWLALRAIAVRCLALHTSLCPELTASHWPFFLLVLQRYAPLVVSSRQASNMNGPTSSIVVSCVHFLVDTQLVHRRMTDPADLDKRANDLFSAVAGLLGLPARQMQLPPQFRRSLTERLCMLLLFGGVWSVDPYSDVGDSPQADDGGSLAAKPAGALDTIPLPARWVLTGLLVEAFYRPPPVVTSMGRTELAQKEATQEASQRGCLLQFFSSLSDLSGMHATLLAAACEGLLATELWRLGVSAQLGCGRRWRALQLPRLLRLLSRHLVAAAGENSPHGTASMMVNVWLECMWRPLALVCLAAKQEQTQTRQLLAEALLATLAAIEVAGESRTPFAAAAEWPAAVAEVTHVLSLIMASWGWRARTGSKAAATKDGASGDPANAATSGDQASSGPSMENAKAPLLKLAARFSRSATQTTTPSASERWPQVQVLARRRRQMLCRAFTDLGVDTRGIVEAATEAVRVRPSRSFLSGSAKKRRRLSQIATPKRARCRLSKMASRRCLKKDISDDDSDVPSVQRPRLEVLEDPMSEGHARRQHREDHEDLVDGLSQEDSRDRRKGRVKKIAKVQVQNPRPEDLAQAKLQRRALAFGF